MIKIGEISRITGVSIQTIRYYEQEGLIKPVEVDHWTGYRYYDDSSIDRLSEILYLKDLGFSLNQIKNLNEQTIKEKVKDIENQIKKLRQNLNRVSSITTSEGEFKMKKFVNDEEVVGKYKKIGIVDEIEDFEKGNIQNERIFNFDELYFLPQGKAYWVFAWTKGTLYLNGRELPYTLKGDKLFIGVTDKKTGNVDCYAVYQKLDSKQYDANDIKIVDDTNIPFIEDEKVVGFWKAFDFIDKKEKFDANNKFWKFDMWLDEYIFKPNGTLLFKTSKSEKYNEINYTKNYVIDKNMSTVSEYEIKEVEGKMFLILEWKSGDYSFGGRINGYYVFVKQQ